jgi:hypothetical protein
MNNESANFFFFFDEEKNLNILFGSSQLHDILVREGKSYVLCVI